MSIGQDKLLSKHQNIILVTQGFYKSLPWLVNRNLLLKIVKCRNIYFLTFYRNIVCKNVSCDVGLNEVFFMLVSLISIVVANVVVKNNILTKENRIQKSDVISIQMGRHKFLFPNANLRFFKPFFLKKNESKF